MVYENRLTVNYAFGTLSQAALLADTVVSSNDFATRLPTGLSSTLYSPMTLHDPGTATHEITWVTAHTAGASTATVLRGREDTTTRVWPAGTMWTIAPTLRDGVLPVPTRSALPTDPHIGLECLIQDEQVKIERYKASWGPPAAHLRQTVSQSLANGVPTMITFTTEEFDNASGHDPAVNTSRYTVKQAGRYQLGGAISFTAHAAGQRAVYWYRNGVTVPGGLNNLAPTSIGQPVIPARPMQMLCAVNDYIELAAYQDSGTVLSTYVAVSEHQPHLSVLYLDL